MENQELLNYIRTANLSDTELISAVESYECRWSDDAYIAAADNPHTSPETIHLLVKSCGLCFFHSRYDFAKYVINHPKTLDKTFDYIVSHDSDNDPDCEAMQREAEEAWAAREN